MTLPSFCNPASLPPPARSEVKLEPHAHSRPPALVAAVQHTKPSICLLVIAISLSNACAVASGEAAAISRIGWLSRCGAEAPRGAILEPDERKGNGARLRFASQSQGKRRGPPRL